MTWSVIQPLNGGMPIGFEWELGKPKYIISNNDKNDIYYLDYVKKRNLNSKIIKMDWDLKNYDEEKSEISKNEFDKIKQVDIVCAVPLCAGLSLLNTNTEENCSVNRGNPENIQNQNMYNITKFVLNEIKPKVYVFENAPTAYTKFGFGVIDRLRKIAKEAGYSVTIEKVNTLNHGIPQKRERTFIYFFNSPNAYILKMEHKNTSNILEFFEKWIDKNSSLQDKYLYKKDIRDPAWFFLEEKVAKPKGKTVIELSKEINGKSFSTTFKTVLKLGLFNELIEYIDELISKFKDEDLKKIKEKYIYYKNKIDKGQNFWDTSNIIPNGEFYNSLTSRSIRYLIHPNGKRTLNKRELLSLMGLPNDYEINEKKSIFLYVLTQSVPTLTAQHAAMNCKLYIEGKLIKANTNFVKQNNVKMTIDEGEIFSLF